MYRTIVVRVIELSRGRLSGALGVVSKLNRDPSFITGLIAHGEERAEESWPRLRSRAHGRPETSRRR
jgi:hypothetical protein